MKPSSAAPTLKDAIALLGDFCRLGDTRRVSKAIDILSALEAPPAAERTALKDVIQTMIEVGIWVEVELREQKIRPAKSEVFQKALKVKNFLESLDAASASEGTKSE